MLIENGSYCFSVHIHTSSDPMLDQLDDFSFHVILFYLRRMTHQRVKVCTADRQQHTGRHTGMHTNTKFSGKLPSESSLLSPIIHKALSSAKIPSRRVTLTGSVRMILPWKEALFLVQDTTCPDTYVLILRSNQWNRNHGSFRWRRERL